MKSTTQEFDFMAALQPAFDKIEAETGEVWNFWLQPLRGDFIENIEDITWSSVQSLIYWSDEAGEDFETSVTTFLQEVEEDFERLKAQNFRPTGSPEEVPLLEEQSHGLKINRSVPRGQVERLEWHIYSAAKQATELGVTFDRFVDLCEAAFDVAPNKEEAR